MLARERAVAAAGLAILTVLAWAYVWERAGTGMSAGAMTAFTFFPHLYPHVGGEMDSSWPFLVASWWAVTVAMMTPGEAPLLLLYGQVLRWRGGAEHAYAYAAALVAGSALVWLVFSAAASALHSALLAAGLLSGIMWSSSSSILSATLLAAAGWYQFSPMKSACLSTCHSAVHFLSLNWRPGLAGSFCLGMQHGVNCLGCCWLMIALLFIGGPMNLAWIAALTLLVLLERSFAPGRHVSHCLGFLLIFWAIVTLLL